MLPPSLGSYYCEDMVLLGNDQTSLCWKLRMKDNWYFDDVTNIVPSKTRDATLHLENAEYIERNSDIACKH